MEPSDELFTAASYELLSSIKAIFDERLVKEHSCISLAIVCV